MALALMRSWPILTTGRSQAPTVVPTSCRRPWSSTRAAGPGSTFAGQVVSPGLFGDFVTASKSVALSVPDGAPGVDNSSSVQVAAGSHGCLEDGSPALRKALREAPTASPQGVAGGPIANWSEVRREGHFSGWGSATRMGLAGFEPATYRL